MERAYIKQKQFLQKLSKIEYIDINKILVSSKESCGTKNSFANFSRYNDDDIIRPLYIKLHKMIGYIKHFERGNEKMSFKLHKMIGYIKHFERGNEKMSFKASDNKLLKKYTKICERVSRLINMKFDSEPVYGDKYINTEIKSYESRINTNFQIKKIPK